jgi:hypothetical protein
MGRDKQKAGWLYRKNRQDGKRQTESRLLDRKNRQDGKRQPESKKVGQEE